MAPEDLIFAIDTSTEQASLAVQGPGEVLAEVGWNGQSNHSRLLVESVRQVLKTASISKEAITAIVVASGPGSFNGLRVGISLAKGMAMGLHVPLVGVSTLDAIALQAAGADCQVWSLIPAGRGEVYRGRYETELNDIRRSEPYDRASVGEVADQTGPHTVLGGPGAELVATEAAARGKKLHLQDGSNRSQLAVYLAELGRRYLAEGGVDQLDTLEPLYLRLSSAEERRGGEK